MAIENILTLGFDGFSVSGGSLADRAAFITNPRFSETDVTNWNLGQSPSFATYGGKSATNYQDPPNDPIVAVLNDTATTLFLSAATAPYVGAATSTYRLLSFVDSTDSDALHCYLEVTPAGGFVLRNGDGTILGSSSTGIITSQAWGILLVTLTIDDSVGACTVVWEGTTVITVTGADTKNGSNAQADKIYFGNYTGWDHISVDKGLSSDTHRGAALVTALRPTSDVAAQWTPDAGSNYANIDEAPYSSADKLTGDTGNKDEYGLGDLGAGTSPTIFGVRFEIFGARTAPVPRGVKMGLKYGVDESQSAEVFLGAAAGIHDYHFPVAPDGSTPWSETIIDGMTATMEVTT